MGNVYKTLLIGAGSIGSQIKDPSSPLPQNYADALSAHEGFVLSAVCDPLSNESIITHRDLDEALNSEHYDVACVAAATNQHARILEKLLNRGLKAIVVEKPMGMNLEESIKICELYERSNFPLLVNYSRRYSQTYANIAKLIRSRESELLNVTIRYAKGLKNNGSHAVDLIFLLADKITGSTPLASCNDFNPDDPSLSAHFKTELCDHVFIHALAETSFTGFEVDITLSDRRFVIYNDHRDMDVWGVKENVGIPPGRRLVYQETVKTDYPTCMMNMLDNLYGVLEGKEQPACTADDACDVAEIVDRLKNGL